MTDARPSASPAPSAARWFPIILRTWNETLRVCTPTVIEHAVGRVRKEDCDRRLHEWSAEACRLAGVRISVRGDEHFDPVRQGETFVVISNHQSSYDIFVLMHTFPGSLRMVAKKEIFRVPIMGGAMRAAGFVALDRGDSARARKALDDAIETFDAGTSVWIAPEGTRSPDGRMLPFKKGGFMLAYNAKRRILPVTLNRTNQVLPSKDYRVRKDQRVEMVVHPPIDPSEYGLEKRDDLMRDVRHAIASGQPEALRA
ncbi:MAG: lysophospholipid acyltransferase family protein [Myxococcota bacterium]